MPNRLPDDGILVRVDGRTRSEIKHMLAGGGVLLNAHAETLLAHPAFDASEARILRIVAGRAGRQKSTGADQLSSA
ncbi:hypothetical protein [Arthrobacter sp. NPDC057259]|uniref:hypothetical protein n=1 Tax=Arthrobacter sp. NPDC057259 TaxID=3346073 RepID=UPI00363FE109